MKKHFFYFLAVLFLFGCSTTRESASFWLLESVPNDFYKQPIPIAIGRNSIMNNILSVKLVEPLNYEGTGSWTFTNKNWNGKGEYYLLYVPMKCNQDGRSFLWLFDEAQIFTGDDSYPIKVKIESNKINFSLKQFKKLFANSVTNQSVTNQTETGFSITFVENKKWDREHIFFMFRPNEPGGLANRANYMGIDFDLAKKIQEANNYSEIQEDLDNLVEARYQAIGNKLKDAVYEYSISWNSCINDFSNFVIEVTQNDWFYDNYICVVSAFHFGLSNWYGNIITRNYNENPIEQRYVTAYELVLSHIFHVCRKYFDKNSVDDQIIWAISEITAALILNEKELLKLWGDKYSPRVDSLSGYPQLIELERELTIIYKNRVDFVSYLKSAILIAKGMNKNFMN